MNDMYHRFPMELLHTVCYRLARVRSLTPVHSSQCTKLSMDTGLSMVRCLMQGDCSKRGGEVENKGDSNKITLEFWYVVYKPCGFFFAS